jgi:hypothetical protein
MDKRENRIEKPLWKEQTSVKSRIGQEMPPRGRIFTTIPDNATNLLDIR